MNLTNEQRNAIAHAVVDVDVWVQHAVATVGEQAVLQKVSRWLPECNSEKERLGSDYMTRAARELQQQV